MEIIYHLLLSFKLNNLPIYIYDKIIIFYLNRLMSSKNKKILFSDDDDDDEEEQEKMKENFERALNKKQFQGEKGKMLFDLQKTYASDLRFKIDDKFKDDISYKKLPSSLKSQIKSKAKETDEFSYNNIDKEPKDEELLNEKHKNLSILSSVLPTSVYLEHKPKETKTKNLLVKRFDPLLSLGDSAVEPEKYIEDKNKVNNKKEDNKIKLEKGVKVFKDPLLNPIYENKYQKEMKKREKERMINKAINEINDNMNGEIIIDYDKWKKGIQIKEEKEFKLFDDGGATPINKEKTCITKETKEEDNKLKDNENIVNDKQLLKKKIKREKQKEKQKKQKEIEKEKKIKQKEKEEQIISEYKNEVTEKYGKEKANNYFRYIEMIRDKNKNKKAKNNSS